MRISQTNLVLWALIVSESAWAYSALAVLGLWMGEDGSPLSWPFVLGLMAVSLYVGRLSPSQVLAGQIEALVRMLIGAAAIYIAIGFELASGFPGIDPAWVLQASSSSKPEGYWFTVIAGGFAGAGLWLRAGTLAVSTYPTDSLALSFRLGIPVLALATIVDIASDADLNIFLMTFVFFAAGLGGLALGNLLPQSQGAGRSTLWPRVIAGIVSTVVAVGLVFSFVPGSVLNLISSPVLAVIDGALVVIAWAFVIPVAFVVSVVFDVIGWLYNLLFGGVTSSIPSPAPEQATSTQSIFEELQELEGTGANVWVFQMLLGLLLGMAALVLLYVGAKAFRRPQRRRVDPVEGQRESVRGDADPLLDLANLLWKLRPAWLTRGAEAFALPEGPPGIVQVLEIYYDLLLLAEERGVNRQPHETTGEFQTRLDVIFPGELVHAATAAFVRAFYGNYPSTQEWIAEMRSYVDRLASEPA